MIATLMLAAAIAAHAPPPIGPPTLVPATIQDSQQFDLPSPTLGRTYRIYLNVPQGPAPARGWPLVYVMDGDAAFDIARQQMPSVDTPEHHRAILVGVGYANESREAVRKLRMRDLTPSRPDPATASGAGMSPDAEGYGHADDMLRFMEEEVQPRIAAAYPIDSTNRALIGYSLGGLFAVRALFTQPQAFRTVAAGSPSLWWNDGEVLKGEAAFARAVEAGRAAPRILITSGGEEETLPPNASPQTRQEIQIGRMIGNARDLAGRLKALHGKPGYTVRYVLFEGETHASGSPAALSRAINFALENEAPPARRERP